MSGTLRVNKGVVEYAQYQTIPTARRLAQDMGVIWTHCLSGGSYRRRRNEYDDPGGLKT